MTGLTEADIAAVRNSDLFDEKWYLEQYPDVKLLGMEPAEHYLWLGAKLGRNPGPKFDGPGYLELNEDVASAGTNPLAHFENYGKKEGRTYNAPRRRDSHVFHISGRDHFNDRESDATYLVMRNDVANSGLWDEKWYLSNYYNLYIARKKHKADDSYFSPLDYYLTEGWKLGHEPSDLLPVDIDQNVVGCNKISYFLNRRRYDGYNFNHNVWIPSQKRIAEYISQKSRRAAKKVVYTCIACNYDSLMQPYYISDDWDYVCFTDDTELLKKNASGVWEIRPLSETGLNGTRSNRWHKMHPHILFPSYEESIYIDGNVNIISNYFFDEIKKRNTFILLPQHFVRNCVYQEIKVLLHSPRIHGDDKIKLKALRTFLNENDFPRELGLSENNVIYRRHNDALCIRIMTHWWDMFSKYAARDQVSLGYVFWTNDLDLNKYIIANCRVNYRDFWIVKHHKVKLDLDELRKSALNPAFESNNIGVVFSTNEDYVSYLGVAIFSLLKNASPSYNYDIIVLGNGLSQSSQSKLVHLATGKPNVSIRFYDTGKLMTSLPEGIFHVEGYVPIETYNKCFITDILSGYDRCLYLDSDIVILDDIQKLHDLEMGNKSIGASVNLANVNAAYCKKEIKGRRFDEYIKNELKISEYTQYFQAGVVLLNMKKLNKMDLRSKSIEALQTVKEPIFFDQCIFNKMFFKDVRFFSTQWNHVWYMQQYSYLKGSVPESVFYDYARSRVSPKIIHYAGGSKPQNTCSWVLSDRFWKYAYQSPFIEDIERDVREKGNAIAHTMAGQDGEEWYKIKPRVLVHLHLYYRDHVERFLATLDNVCDCNFDLFVTMTERDENTERKLLSRFPSAKLLATPNVGYDIFPFLHVLQQVRLANYEFILKLHTKNQRAPGLDTVYGVEVPGFQWRDELIDALAGSKDIFRKNLDLMLKDDRVGCLGAQRFIFSTENNGEEKNYKLSEWRGRCGVSSGHTYVGGSMFFARAYPFERLSALNMKPEHFKGSAMATKDHKNMAHIFERLLGIVIEAEGFEIKGL